jgi:site-specific DNA-cytosine methylase
MNVLSLFDGMSCGRIALDRVGIKVDNYFASEIDKHAIKVSKANWSDIKHVGDVTLLQAKDLPKIDLLIGGSPCQGFSRIGKQLNFNDPKSSLFWEYIRLLEECNPTYFLLENNPMKQEWQDVISRYLGVEPVKINSCLVSAQSRKRLYWTNIPGLVVPHDLGIKLQHILEGGEAHREKSKCVRVGGRGSNDRHEWDIANKEGRRYTVRELERLQTVPEGYCDSMTTTQAYKVLGNGWTVDVITHIFQPLRAIYEAK